jgi:hypothetical protein
MRAKPEGLKSVGIKLIEQKKQFRNPEIIGIKSNLQKCGPLGDCNPDCSPCDVCEPW